MTLKLPFPAPAASRARRLPLGLADVAVLGGVAVLFIVLAILSVGVTAPFGPGELPQVTTDPANLPYYAGRSLLRMFAALGVSTLFAIGYGYLAAKNRRAARVLVPLLDVLQSVPVLGFLSITITGFIALFPGSLLGLECASVFAIFTSMAWNMTFSVYHSFLTVPRDHDEAARMYHLSRRLRLRRVELPGATVGLVWNAMMSMGGAWFFLVASEAITVNNASYTLPGMGSYMAEAIGAQDYTALAWAVVTMFLMIIAVDRLFWRPLVAWAERFKVEESASGQVVESAVLNVLRRSAVVAAVRHAATGVSRRVTRTIRRSATVRDRDLGAGDEPRAPGSVERALRSDAFFNACLAVAAVAGICAFVAYAAGHVSIDEIGTILLDGTFTFIRVVVVVAVSAIIWTPIGAWIGMNPRASRIAQPIVQIGASFPANFLFPFATILMLRTGFPIELGAIPLMALGSQWYILFNSIAGGMAIPNDLREAGAVLGLSRRQRWRALILPAIFPAWVTGGIAAAGGAWNASIVAETVAWGNDTLRAPGLGSDIAASTAAGNFPLTIVAIAVMVLFVVGLNRLFWQRLYTLAETRYRLA